MQPGLSATTSLPLRNAVSAMAARRSGTAAVTIRSIDGSPSRSSGSSLQAASGHRSRAVRATAADWSSEERPTSSQPWPSKPCDLPEGVRVVQADGGEPYRPISEVWCGHR